MADQVVTGRKHVAITKPRRAAIASLIPPETLALYRNDWLLFFLFLFGGRGVGRGLTQRPCCARRNQKRDLRTREMVEVIAALPARATLRAP